MVEGVETEAEDRTVSHPLFWLALASAAGMLLGRWTDLPPLGWLVPGVLALPVAWFGSERWRAAGVVLGVVAASALVFQTRALVLPVTHLFHRTGTEPGAFRLHLEVVEDPVERSTADDVSRREFQAEVRAVWLGGDWLPASGRVACRVEGGMDGAPGYGDLLEGWAYLAPPDRPSNPGEFDHAAWLRGRGILHEALMREGDWSVIARGGGWWIQRQAIAFKHHMRRMLAIGLENNPEATGLMSAMLFGFRDGVAEPVEEDFRVTGTMHLFAVSGQNVGIILGMLVLVLRAVGLLRWRWSWAALPLVLVFCLSTGMQPSAFRAFVMAALVSVGWAFYRPVGLFNVLGAAALFMFVWDPRMLFDLGFQLSFVVLLGIAALAPCFLRLWVRWGAPDPWIPRRLLPPWRLRMEHLWRMAGTVVAVSSAAWLASLPHGLWHFHLFAPVALLANIVVVPVAGAVLVLSAVSVVLGSVFWALAAAPNLCSAFLLKIMVVLVGNLASWPGGHHWVSLPWNRPSAGIVRMTVLHHRQAAPVVVQSGSSAWLVDPGPEAAWSYVVDPFRRRQGIDSWDAVVLGNGGARRMGSAQTVLESTPVQTWIESGWRSRSRVQHAWLGLMEDRAVGKTFWRRGDRAFWPGGWTVEVLWPGREMPHERLEDRGLVFRASGPGGSVLFAGDVSAEVESTLVQDGAAVRADVLIQGEHSRSRNLSGPWLEAVGPRWIIRPGRGYQPDGSLDHSFWSDASRLGIRVLRQDRTGAVTLDFTPDGLSVQPFLTEAEGDPDARGAASAVVPTME